MDLTSLNLNLTQFLVTAIFAFLAAIIGVWVEHRHFKQQINQRDEELDQEHAEFKERIEADQAHFQLQIDQQRDQFEKQIELQRAQIELQRAQLEEQISLQRAQFELDLAKLTAEIFPQQILEDWDPIIPKDWKPILEDKEKQEILIENPYIVGPPVTQPQYFVNRTEQVKNFYDNLLGPQLHSISILGIRRAGKTSFLKYVSHPETLNRKFGPNRSRPVFVYLDALAAITNPNKFWARLVSSTLEAIERTIGPQAPINLPKSTDYDFILADIFFTKLCRKGLRFVVILDEFERLAKQNEFPLPFFDSLRSLATSNNLCWVVTTYRNIYHVLRDVGLDKTSPFFNIFLPLPIYLSKFSLQEAQEVITRPAKDGGVQFSEDEINHIIETAGRLPYMLQLAASSLYRDKRHGVSGALALQNMVADFSKGSNVLFEGYWSKFSDEERDILCRLVMGKPITLADRDLVHDLSEYGLIDINNGVPEILSQAFAVFIRTQCPQNNGIILTSTLS